MTEFNPKQGEVIHVRNGKGSAWSERTFVAKYRGLYHCELFGDDRLYPWADAKPLPTGPEPTTFTHETWPKQPAYVAFKGEEKDKSWLMLGFHASGIRTSSRSITFVGLEDNYLISLDFCQTWQPCHYVPERG